MTQDECESMNNCLLLLRNVLHIPENCVLSPGGSSHCSKQNQILWNLFTQSVDKILIQMMTYPQRVRQLFHYIIEYIMNFIVMCCVVKVVPIIVKPLCKRT